MDNGQPQKRKKLVGLIVIGSCLIIGALIQLSAIVNYQQYKYYLDDLPPLALFIRYVISCGQRFLGIISGVGLIAHRRWAAKTAIFLSVLNILAVYWRYPYRSFEKQSMSWDRQWGVMLERLGCPGCHFSSYILPGVIATCILDVLFFSFILYYLTRPHVRERLI
jgi:hypothetical protein